MDKNLGLGKGLSALMGDDFTYKYEGRFQRNELVMNYINPLR